MELIGLYQLGKRGKISGDPFGVGTEENTTIRVTSDDWRVTSLAETAKRGIGETAKRQRDKPGKQFKLDKQGPLLP